MYRIATVDMDLHVLANRAKSGHFSPFVLGESASQIKQTISGIARQRCILRECEIWRVRTWRLRRRDEGGGQGTMVKQGVGFFRSGNGIVALT